MIQAADSLVCVFIECNWGKANADLSGRYGVGGYPTVLFCDPDGKAIGELNSHDPAAVAKQMQQVAAKFGAKPVAPVAEAKQITGMPIGEALAAGRKAKKPVAILFFDDSPASVTVHGALSDDLLKDSLSRVVFGLEEYRRGSPECVRFDVTRAPTLLVLDSALAKPEEKPLGRIEGSRGARELKRDLDSALASSGVEVPAAPASSAEDRGPRAPVEKLSDDELERKFIQARISAAMELKKKGKTDKAIETLEDVIKSYPKHVETLVAKKLLADMRK